MTETELLDKAFLYSKIETELYIHHGNLTKYLGDEGKGVRLERLLETLWKLGFMDRSENRQATMGGNHPFYDYGINSNGIHFLEDVPVEFKDTPYKYHLQLLENERIRQREKENLDRRQTQSVITTNKLTWWNVGVTIAFGIIVTITQVLTCNREKLRDHREERKLNQDSLRQSSQSIHESLLQNRAFQLLEDIRDSLTKTKIETNPK